MTRRAMWLRCPLAPLDLISGLRPYGAAPMLEKALATSWVAGLAIAAVLVVSQVADAEEAGSEPPGTVTTPALRASSAITGPNDVNLDSPGTGGAGRYPQGWLHIAEAISPSPVNTEADPRDVNPCQVTDGDGFLAQFELFSEALDRFGSLF